MTRETTLDAFASASPESAESVIQTTMTSSPDGGPCADCGRTVTRRWRDETGLVCPACKQWHRS